jgi:quercetin dioxygenase-like cupin family protein
MKRSRTTPMLLLMASILFTPATLVGQSVAAAAKDKPHAIVALPNAIKWGPAPPILPPGAQAAVLEGDPAQPGSFTLRLSLPANYRIPPHYHPVTEHVTVLEGTFYVGMGETFDASQATNLPAGTFAALEPGVRHFALTKGPTVIQLHGVGPWGLIYVNAADDPRNNAKE